MKAIIRTENGFYCSTVFAFLEKGLQKTSVWGKIKEKFKKWFF